jgi:hypothetical protein
LQFVSDSDNSLESSPSEHPDMTPDVERNGGSRISEAAEPETTKDVPT